MPGSEAVPSRKRSSTAWRSRTPGVDQGLISVIAEEFNRQADALATSAVALHNLPEALVDAAKQCHRFAVLLSVAVAIYDRRHRTLPLPHRRAGYTQAQLIKMGPNPLSGGAPNPPPGAPPASAPLLQDLDELWDEAERDSPLDYDDDEDPFGFGGT